MTLDHGPTQTDSWPNDDEIDYDDSYGDGSFEAQTSGYLDRSDSGAADVLQLSNENSLTGEISFSVDVDEIVDVARFGWDCGCVRVDAIAACITVDTFAAAIADIVGRRREFK